MQGPFRAWDVQGMRFPELCSGLVCGAPFELGERRLYGAHVWDEEMIVRSLLLI